MVQNTFYLTEDEYIPGDRPMVQNSEPQTVTSVTIGHRAKHTSTQTCHTTTPTCFITSMLTHSMDHLAKPINNNHDGIVSSTFWQSSDEINGNDLPDVTRNLSGHQLS